MVRKALLVGCNYANNPKVPDANKLYGCINDVNAMQALINKRFSFENQNITILTDKPESEKKPTQDNILNGLKKLIDEAKPGDTLLFYFSGGGALVNTPVNPPVRNEIKKGIPAIIPCDLKPITGLKILLRISQLPANATFTFVSDSSYSGGLLDEDVPNESIVRDDVPNYGWKTIPSNILVSDQPINVGAPSHTSLNNKILISSSRANEESVEVYPNCDKSKAYGAFSNEIQTLLNSPQAVNPPVARNDPRARNTNKEVAALTRALLVTLGFVQNPFLNCSDNDAAAPFLGNVA